jgi:pimeloyl-ACP methyl ester carboxylesterase
MEMLTDARLFYRGFHNEAVVIDGHRIHYYEGGHGSRNVLLVHGLGGRAEDWANLMPQLKQAGFHVYAIDLLGYGRSDRPQDATFSVPEEARYVESFLDREQLGSVDLAGWSMGGWIAMKVASDTPERVRRLVLCDAAGLRFTPPFGPEVMTPSDEEGMPRLYRLLMPGPRPLPDFLARALLRRTRETEWVRRRSIQSMLNGTDLMDGKLGALRMPTLIIWGAQDHLIPPSVGLALHRALPQSVFEVYEGCGHLAPGQCADRIAPRLLAFLEGNPPQAAAEETIPAP